MKIQGWKTPDESDIPKDVSVELVRSSVKIIERMDAENVCPLAIAIVVTTAPHLTYNNIKDGDRIPRIFTIVDAINFGVNMQGDDLACDVLKRGLDVVKRRMAEKQNGDRAS